MADIGHHGHNFSDGMADHGMPCHGPCFAMPSLPLARGFSETLMSQAEDTSIDEFVRAEGLELAMREQQTYYHAVTSATFKLPTRSPTDSVQ
jgi:hypothetical protein